MDTTTIDTDAEDTAEPAPFARDLIRLYDAVLDLPFNATPEQVAAVRDAVKFAGQEARRIGQMLDGRLVEMVQESGDDIALPNGIRLYVGTEKKTRERSKPAVVDALLKASGGDMAVLDECLASSPFKHGAVRSRLEAAGMVGAYDELFETTVTPELKEGKPTGRPVRKLMESDPRFAR